VVLSGGGQLQKFTVEVYANDKDVIAACKADSTVTDKTKCDDINFAKFQFAGPITQTTNPTEAKAGTVAQTLYAFVVRVISVLITWLQSIIYRIFAYIIVPILKALLSVRPYQDTFVNIIYPGWLILRNLANIFFIVALLVVGLRILFQQSQSSTARGFIIRLIIMALLVNFSLVIAQGVVGIADTVQAQFLPKDSRVIEALGAKLMVEPLKAFRASVAGDSAAFTAPEAELSLADTLKPIILLMLSVAAFWSFVALAGFLMVRLVVLWILYLTSPIAYVGFVMEETRGYAKRWWREFIRYTTITPVLVFFLNIAALMATVFASTNNSLFSFGDGSTSSDIVIGSLTILTHFIVLGVMFAGMKFAMSSGTYGSKAIVDFAQKGFKNTLTKWPIAAKDSLTNYAASKIEKVSPGAAKGLTAVMKPVDFAKAVKKAQWDDRGARRIKANQDRINDTFLTRGARDKTNKIGSTFKNGQDFYKELSDNPSALRDEFQAQAKKGNKDNLGQVMRKMSNEGKFKEMLEEGGRVTGNTYSNDAVGLNKMTEDLQKVGKISGDQRRDLLSEFDKDAKKKKENNHFGGNMVYDAADKKNKWKARQTSEDAAGNWVFSNNEYGDENGWLRSSIKARTDNNDKGMLRQDLIKTDVSQAVQGVGNDSRFTKAQAAVFAETNERALANPKTWDAFRENNGSKYDRMVETMQSGDARNDMHQNMVQYYNTLAGAGGDPEAGNKATHRMNAIMDRMDIDRTTGLLRGTAARPGQNQNRTEYNGEYG
ncbi:MAG TPA: hypothetical protein VHQ20_01655, partial [Patescibacteria group bacterium]|nr:hypothetical protein [Patescibacteria group bacterium]